jgi:hypothetical protein
MNWLAKLISYMSAYNCMYCMMLLMKKEKGETVHNVTVPTRNATHSNDHDS